MNKRFKIVTLGCRTNQYESQGYRDQLLQLGYQEVEDDQEADLCIVNSCTVTDNADKQSRQEVRKLAKNNKRAQIVVTGCASEGDKEGFLKLGNVTHVVPNQEKENLLRHIMPDVADLPEFQINRFEAHTRAFVKVQDGCNSYCTYCIIPYMRGRSRSRAVPEILDEIKGLVNNGYKEVVLTGINIGDFEAENNFRLSHLVKEVDKIPGLERIRISSIDPDEVDDALLDAVINGKKTCHCLHLVLQSGSNVILKRMNRKYNRQIFLDTVERLRKASSDFTFTTDVIVGFPGETETDFQETLDLMKEVKFTKVHMFPYSERKRTRAALYPNKVPPEEMQRRRQILLRQSEQDAFLLRERFLGRELLLLTEAKDEKMPGWISGHTANFLPVSLFDETLNANELVMVKLIENTPTGFIAVRSDNP